MRTTLLTIVMIGANSLIPSGPAEAQERRAEVRSRRIKIVKPPVLESATNDAAVIRWTDTTGGGTHKHYGIVRYGTDPKHLDRTARSPIKCKKTEPSLTYRVWIDGLAPKTTYYYTVDAAQADGIGMGLKSPVNKFTTRPGP
ncbi:MAG: hypothetical protein JWO36_2232 [Myxococcales bacterium]|nr:hypothetical protein [Myxococcales bacterium]